MQFLYLQNYFSLWFKLSSFFSLDLFSLEIHNKSGEKLTGRKLNVHRQFLSDVLSVTLLLKGVGQYKFLGKIATHFPHFHFLPKWRFLYIPSIPFYYKPPPIPPTVLLINNIYYCKSKLKYTGVNITCFFKMQNLRQQNIKSIYWKRLIEPVSFLQKRLTVYSPKEFSQKVPT